jgi:hypothetical protein
MRCGRRSTRRVAWMSALAALVLTVGAPPASAATNEVGRTGTVVDGTVAVGGLTLPEGMGAVINPFATFATPALQRTGARVFDVPGAFEDFAEWDGTVYALRSIGFGTSDVFAFNASGAPVVACDDDGMSDAFSGVFGGLFTSDEYIFLFGHTGASDSAKLILRLDFNCQPVEGGGFDEDGRMTLNPTAGADLFTAGEYDTLGAIGVIALVGSEGGNGEIDLFTEDGAPVTAFDGDGSLTIDLTGNLSFFDIELFENGNGMIDGSDRVFFAGQHDTDAIIGVTDGTGATPTGTHCGTAVGSDAIVQIFDAAPGAANNRVEGLAIRGSAVFAGATIFTAGSEGEALINTYLLSNLCDMSSTGSQSWVRVLEGFQALDNDVSELVPFGSAVFAVGSLDNPQTQSFDAYVAGPFSSSLQRQGLLVVDDPGATPGPGPGPGPDPGTPGSGGTGVVVPPPGDDLILGDFNGNGTVDAADYVVWRKGQVTEDYLRVRQRAVGGYAAGDSVVHYSEWRSNFGRSSSSQRRRPRQILFARGRVRLRGGQSKLVRVPLTKAGKRQVRRYTGKRLRGTLRLRVTYRPASGAPAQTQTFRQAVRLRVVKPRRRD